MIYCRRTRTMAEFKPCPFCGSELIECYEEKGGQFYCICACGVCGPDGETEQEAIDAWNKRS